ncbi:DUF4145 domain-containing protein [Hyunsoonleella pacifica]|uniref:DUF4145 domain-containing protein n=1 Tax=Hyunsoonleella pacifica TaxID=1080224 RepID=A0A4Q9FLJ6_9FLAO|nr:DUF4145 domain-containing protein [Hyunsoonleella pacifica]TBN14514.1 DUF4145 domain-containing protein [Hyunsoonleella pacifica]GGD14426.1 hypothetical protein GCM10011368_15440 [Hyunsoonleella pacifica]
MKLQQYLLLSKCPHCKIDSPSLRELHSFPTQATDAKNGRIWKIYSCQRCGGVVSAYSWTQGGYVEKYYPESESLSDSIPFKAKSFLEQAINSIHAPSGAIMLCASSVDAMLKEKGYNQGSLYSRINTAVTDHLITDNMATWAHEVRLDANDERHADEDADLPDSDDAQKAIDFTIALGEYLFVLPSRIQRGIENASGNTETEN